MKRALAAVAAVSLGAGVLLAGGESGSVMIAPPGFGEKKDDDAAASTPSTSGQVACAPGSGSGVLPKPGTQRRDSIKQPALPIPADFKKLYVEAGKKYGLPWELLAGVGMIEMKHGRHKGTSPVGAKGPMQFMPATWAAYGVDGNGDGKVDIMDPADAIHSAANYLKASGAPKNTTGALFAYNRAQWYVNDVLFYAQHYGAETCEPKPAVSLENVKNLGFANGRLPDSVLHPLKTASGHRMRKEAADAFDQMSEAYKARFGGHICVTDSYRSYAAQVDVRRRKPSLAAKPGTSNHGLGLAVDLGCGINRFGTAQHQWMVQNAARFGFKHPGWAQQGGSKPEAWHWEYKGARE